MSSKFVAVPYRMKVRFSSHTYVLRSTRISLSREDLRMTSLYDLALLSGQEEWSGFVTVLLCVASQLGCRCCIL